MANKKNNPGNAFVKKPDSQPWNRSQMEIEPIPENQAAPQAPQKPRYNDRIKISPMDEQGRATDKALSGWAEGIKKA